MQRQKAQADKSYEIQTAVMEQQVVAEKLKVQLVEREAQIKAQEAEIKRREKELQATTLKKAEVDAEQIKVMAEATKRKLELEAEGAALAALKQGQAKAAVTRLTGGDVINARRGMGLGVEGGAAPASAVEPPGTPPPGELEAALDRLKDGLDEATYEKVLEILASEETSLPVSPQREPNVDPH